MSERIKLLVITHNYPRFEGDFAGVFLQLLNRRLVERGIDPIILAPHYPGSPEHEEGHGVKIVRFRYADKDEDENLAYHGQMHKLVLSSVGGIFALKNFLNHFRREAERIIENEKIDIVAGHWLVPAGLVMKPLMNKYRMPMVMSSHGTDIRLMSKYMGAVYRFLQPFCRRLHSWTVVSSFLRNEIVKQDRRLDSILKVLPLPHDEALFFIDDSIERDKNLIVSVTRFTEQKRVEKLVEAFAFVAEKNSAARLEIYGEGELRAKIEAQIISLNLFDRITINPPVPQKELREVYNRASIVVLNSYREGFGLALSEAMLCGAAVVGVNSGGITDIIEHEKTGLLAELDNSQSIAANLNRLLADETLRQSLAGAGNQHARAHFSSGPLAAEYAELIKAALGRA